MGSKKFSKNSFKPDRLHWVAANDWPDEVQKCLNQNFNPYQPNKDGLSPLHAAIGNNATRAARLLLARFADDLAIVKEHMRKRFLWKMESNVWNKRPILVAWTDEECQQLQSIASTCPSAIPLNVQIFVFLRTACQGVQLMSLDVCSAEKRPAIVRFVRQILANGVLSVDRSDFRADCMTYLQTACYVGSKELLVELISNGAQLSATGDEGKNALLTACDTVKKELIELLLTKYIARYDPTSCDREQRNAFHIIARKDKPELADFVLKSLIRYRVVHFGETEPEAFSRTFRYEYSELDCLTTWMFLSPKMRQMCSQYIVPYRMDLTYKWRSNLTVMDLISKKIALDYCFEEIRRNADILKMEAYQPMNLLQTLLLNNYIEFIEEMYLHNPSLKEEFNNNEGAFELLRSALANRNEKLLNFILLHHKEYFRSESNNLEENIINVTWFDKSVYRKPFSLLAEAFPEMKDKITKTVQHIQRTKGDRSFSNTFYELKNNFEQAMTTLQSEGILMKDVVDENGRNVLHQAAEWDEKDLVMKLLDSSLDLHRRDNDGNLPIFLIRTVEVLDLFLAHVSIDATTVNDAGYNLLHHCCKFGHEASIVRKLLAMEFDVNQVTNDGNVPLSLAACCSLVRFLLEHGAAVELIDGSALQKTLPGKRYCAAWALIPKVAHLAWFEEMAHAFLPWMLGNQNRDFFTCSCGEHLENHPAIRKTLFDSLYRHSRDQATDFFRDVCQRAINCCARWFLDYGYDIDFEHCDEYGYTPLLGLLGYMEEPNQDVIERLVRKGVNVNAVNDRKRHSLLVLASHFRSAQWYGHTLKTVELLLDHGAALNVQDEDGNTALHHAFEEGQLALVELLLERGADTTLRNNENQLPYQKCGSNMVPLFRFLG